MSEHSPEPWTVTSTKYGWFAVHAADGMPVGLLQVSNKDMERIMVCVNACRDVLTAKNREDTLQKFLDRWKDDMAAMQNAVMMTGIPPKTSEPECCGKCRFWQEMAQLNPQPGSTRPIGRCRSKPVYQEHWSSDWCGEFKEIVKP